MQESSLTIYEITDNAQWDNFVTSCPAHTFLHSWAWGEFNEAMEDKIWRLGVFNVTQTPPKLIAVAMVIKVHARRGNFLFVPHGPVLATGEQIFTFPSFAKATEGRQFLIFRKLIDHLKNLAKKERVSFIRISPLLEDNSENRQLFKQLDFRPAPIHMHAETTWTLDLTLTEDELLANMRKTTRNLIRRAKKDGVTVTSTTDERDVEIFNLLYQQTVKKHQFTPFSLTFLLKQVKIFKESSPNADVKIFTAWHADNPIASAILIFYGNSAFYHHGASIPSKIPGAYLLQWEAILESKRRGHELYNFWGIVKEDASKNHPWQGITLFKKGFGGFQTDYLHAQDLAIGWKYPLVRLFEILRKKKRNL